MDNSEYIENYFSGTPVPEEAHLFEKRIESDPDFAEEVAFYLSAHTVAREIAQSEKKQQFRDIYQKSQKDSNLPVIKTSKTTIIRKLVYPVAAAAAVAGIVFGIYTMNSAVSPAKLAAQYEKEHLENLPVTMSSRSDSVQTGIRLYNEGKPAEALQQFEKIIQSDISSYTAKKYAGLACLRLKNYDKALGYFVQLGAYKELYSNPAIFYEALTLMERNQAGDASKAKLLLQQIVQNDLEGKETAQEWLKKM
jgi:tetratricopeptide (TPR) repeat protein